MNFSVERGIGGGTFGEVYFGRMEGAPKAIKVFQRIDTRERQVYIEGDLRLRINGPLEESSYRAHCQGAVEGVDRLDAVGIIVERSGICGIAVMPFVDGDTLFQCQRPSFRLPLHQVVIIAKQTLSFLVQLEKAGLVHGDLTPANMMVSRRNAKLSVIDWSSAFFSHHFRGAQDPTTALHYRDPYGRDIDAFAAGIGLWELISCQPLVISSRTDQKALSLEEKYVEHLFHRFEDPPVPHCAREAGRMSLFPEIALTDGYRVSLERRPHLTLSGYDAINKAFCNTELGKKMEGVVRGLMSLRLQERRPVAEMLEDVSSWCRTLSLLHEGLSPAAFQIAIRSQNPDLPMYSIERELLILIDRTKPETKLHLLLPCNFLIEDEKGTMIEKFTDLGQYPEGAKFDFRRRVWVAPEGGAAEEKKGDEAACSGAGVPFGVEMAPHRRWKEEIEIEVVGGAGEVTPIPSESRKLPFDAEKGKVSMKIPFAGRFVKIEAAGDEPFFAPVSEGALIDLRQKRAEISLETRIKKVVGCVFFTENGQMRHEISLSADSTKPVFLQAGQYRVAARARGHAGRCYTLVQSSFSASPGGRMGLDALILEGVSLKILRSPTALRMQLLLGSLPYATTHCVIGRGAGRSETYSIQKLREMQGVIPLESEADIATITPYENEAPWNRVILPLFAARQTLYPPPCDVQKINEGIMRLTITSYLTPDTIFFGEKQNSVIFIKEPKEKWLDLWYLRGSQIKMDF